ncbi:LPS assembly lipoprotein LptE [Trichlorobacter lovleyi]|nr:LptE family protein [Trichlorobacter lovleyi]
MMLLLLVLSAAGCGYRFTADSGTRLPAGQTVWVPFFKNATVYANGSVALKRAIFDQFAEQRGILPAASAEQADLILEGTLTGYGAGVVSYSAADKAREYRLTITADIAVRQRGAAKDSAPLWRGTLSAWQDYPVAATIELQRSNEDAALTAASRKLAQQLIWSLEQQY